MPDQDPDQVQDKERERERQIRRRRRGRKKRRRRRKQEEKEGEKEKEKGTEKATRGILFRCPWGTPNFTFGNSRVHFEALGNQFWVPGLPKDAKASHRSPK